MSEEGDGRVTLAVLKKELEHVVESLSELKAELKSFVQEHRETTVLKDEFLDLKMQVTQNQTDITKLKAFHIHMVALASILSPVILLVLRHFIGGMFGS